MLDTYKVNFFFFFCISTFNVLPAVSVLLFHTLKWPRKGQIIVPLNHYFLWNKKLARHLISSYEGFSMCWSDVNYFFRAKIVLFHLITCGKNLFGLSILICEHFASHIQYPNMQSCKFWVSLVFMLINRWVTLLP